ncbi:hypothetical protein SAMN04487948_101477 [Halogranum amylolyticum]|uniref:DUF8159 domain-containing protein n=1 Tax=Halogranum amylolyticum TaxID=660520 RepID=A0A1H8NDN8_9EURY|nr:hypothetical protein [Halogranum amylolyticum]SEO27598.1 hypothetical protein SAMN04487948_101477 [Halogranum amylolyticum]
MTDELTGLEAELRSNGISVERVDRGETVELVYMTAFPGPTVHHMEMGRALNVFIDLAKADRWDPKPVEATVIRSEDDVQGTWRAEPKWFEGLLEYRLSEEDFSERVLGTLSEPAAAASSTEEESA